VSDGRGRLAIRQPSTNDIVRGADNARNAWDVHLNDHVPMQVSVDEGAGTNNLTLGSLSLTGLEVNVGAGDNHIDLSGAWTHGFSALIHSGAGNLTVQLPSRVGVRVTVDNGFFGDLVTGDLRRDGNTYVNAAYGTSPVTVNVSISHGLGNVTLQTAD
jgi:hypothetical protein